MAIIKCKMCGGDLELIPGQSVAECEYCGSRQTVPVADNDKKITLFARANRLRAACEFDKAAGVYESIVADFPEEAEAYWGLVLCKYGIEYVDDPATGKKIPTCHRSSFDSIMEDSDFEQALENADVVARKQYREEAKQIEEIRKGIIAVSANEQPYDIFICYKETDENGERTLDSVLAQDIYDALTAKNYRVFFSRITLEDKLGLEYEPYIFAALNSAKIMLAVGTDYEYYNAVWVKNEWSRYLKLMAKDKDKHLIPCFKGIDAYDMPKEFARLQAQDLGKVGAMQDLLRGIEKILPKNQSVAIAQGQTIVTGNATADSLLKRTFLFLEDKDWKTADEYCEKVLDIDPENAQAYLGKVMVTLKCSSADQIATRLVTLDSMKDFVRAIQFATGKDLEKLQEIRNASQKKQLYKQLANQLSRFYAKKAKVENTYLKAKKLMLVAKTREEYLSISRMFASISDYADSAQLKVQCEEMVTHLDQEDLIKFRVLADKYIDWAEKAEDDMQIYQLKVDYQWCRNELEKAEKMRTDLKNTLAASAKAESEINKSQQKIISLKKERENLGLFTGKRKKAIDAEIERLQESIKQLSLKISNLQKQLNGFPSDLELEHSISTRNKQLDDICNKLSEAESRSFEAKNNLEAILGEMCSNNLYHAAMTDRNMDLLYNMVIHSLSINETIALSLGQYMGEPIEWLVLHEKNHKLLLVSKYALMYKAYNETYSDVTWESCSLRNWLNDSFLNVAFSTEEQSMILAQKAPAGENPNYTTMPGNTTRDKVFLLSIAEVKQYFLTDQARKCRLVDSMVYSSDNNRSNCSWWLRSPGDRQSYAACISEVGYISSAGNRVDNSTVAVRPAIWVNLDMNQ